MTTREKPPRSWRVDDLLDLGEKGGVTYLKAIPVLMLQRWVQGGREEGVANHVWTEELAKRLVSSGLVRPFKPKGTSNVPAALIRIQNSRNLTRPRLIENKGGGIFWVNLPYYESLLQDYHQKYCELYPKEYEKLFPEGEPEWKSPSPPKVRAEREAERVLAESEARDGIQSILATIEQALRDRQQAVERLTEENQRLQAQLEARTKAAPEVSFVHTSPGFHRSAYGTTVTSIKDTIRDMLKRAEHAIRISTRQMDMFTDELIDLKRRNPDIEITVLSRGPSGAEGDRKRLAGRAFERMKQAGIKLPVEKDTLHSRLVVIDAKEVLVSSADLDFTQLEGEFNAGIWTNNLDAVTEAIRYFDNLLGLSQGN
ncbi:MAG TPA: phospholipase D-like domain-containing protein [Anaerolineae bacterium]|nr:phospholipase D-like domain-containing protein [Anaerolineae bacterium]